MDVTCQRCKAEYEFDETLLGAKGTTVKCSSCAHVFRVLPPEHEQGRTPLELRFAKNGSVRAIASLRELQQLIRAGEVGLDDELGREGFPFRPLRDLPELKNFFARAPEKTTVRPEPGAVPPAQSKGGGAASVGADRTPSLPVRSETLLGTSPTARPPAMAASARSPEHEPGSELLDAPTVVAPIPEEIREARAAHAAQTASAARTAQTAKRTMMGVGPVVSEQSDGSRPSAATVDSLGTSRPSLPAGLEREPAGRPAASNTSPAGTLVGAPARAFPTAREAGLPSYSAREGGSPAGPRHHDDPPAIVAPRYDEPAGGSAFAAGASPYGAAQPESASESADSSHEGEADDAAPVRLYLEDDEIPRDRVTKSSSTLWVALALAALVVGGWFGMTAWQKAQRASETSLAMAEPAAPDAALATGLATGAEAAGAAQAVDDAGALTETGEEPSEPAAEGSESAESPAEERSTESERAAPTGDDERVERASAAGDDSRTKKSPRELSRARESEETAASSRRSASEPKGYGEWVSRGDQLSAQGDHAGAGKAYEAALSERPTGSEANSGLGFSLLRRGRARDALPHFDRAASSGFAEANVGLGDVYRKLGQPSSALEAYETYLERLPSGARAEYARGWVERLKGGGSAPTKEEAEETPPPAEAPPDEAYRPAGELLAPSSEANSNDENAQ